MDADSSSCRAKVEAQGYKVPKLKRGNACGELYTIDKNGSRVELFVDPTNGPDHRPDVTTSE